MSEGAQTRKRIMLVDDNVTNLMFAKSALSDHHDVYTAPSAAKMFQLLDSTKVDLVLLDIEMPVMDGIEAIGILKSNPLTKDIPVIFLTALSDPGSEVRGLDLGAVDYISKPFEPGLLNKRVEIHLTMEDQKAQLSLQKKELQNYNENLQAMVMEKTRRVDELQGAILATVADLVESRDDVTGSHVDRTRRWLEILVEALLASGDYVSEMKGWNLPLLYRSSQLHDVGKISISDSILLKRGRLTLDEFELIKLHTTFGERIIDKIATKTAEHDFLHHAKIFAATHHEKWDGTGYPKGLCGNAIPLQGRLLAIADVYDALTSPRPYKIAFPHDYAVEIMLSERAKHFDPVLLDIFRANHHRFVREIFL
ncbi:MAG: response regulator [Deltaproteobacteria bacterium]|jgi:putative two-component system response regulator|nr:response regulator [Deltaproteobacteria bacterium]